VEARYAQPHQRYWVDLGCAGGTFALDLAQKDPTLNVLGLEIRGSLVERANWRRDQLNLGNLHYIKSNANIDLRRVMSDLIPFGGVHVASIFFPDPWWKKKHQKRRVVTDELVDIFGELMAPDGMVLLQSDVLELTAQMREFFARSEHFSDLHCGDDENYMEHSPLLIATEREISVQRRGLSVYRSVMLRPKHIPGTALPCAVMSSKNNTGDRLPTQSTPPMADVLQDTDGEDTQVATPEQHPLPPGPPTPSSTWEALTKYAKKKIGML
jgi:tRNA (guanine-N7-)-methyltransferase